MDLITDLKKLGPDRFRIADSLRKMGIRGVRQVHECCPIAVYLHQLHPDHKFEVSNDRIQIDGEGRCVIPAPVDDFIFAFDRGGFPDLEDTLHAGQAVEPKGGGS